MIRREIAGDNSCLFNAVGYGMHKVRSRSAHLRGVVAKTVSADREQYTEVVLEKSNEEVGDAVCTAQQYLFWSVVMQAGCHRGHRFLVQRVWLFGWDLLYVNHLVGDSLWAQSCTRGFEKLVKVWE